MARSAVMNGQEHAHFVSHLPDSLLYGLEGSKMRSHSNTRSASQIGVAAEAVQ